MAIEVPQNEEIFGGGEKGREKKESVPSIGEERIGERTH